MCMPLKKRHICRCLYICSIDIGGNMFIYKDRAVHLLSHYIYDPDYEEFRREMDVLIAHVLGHNISYEYDYANNYLIVKYLVNGEYVELPYYCTDLNAALSLFSTEYRVVLTFLNIQVANPESDRPLGEWKVRYEYWVGDRKFEYLPGSGSYFRPAEAVVRAWLAYKDIGLIHKYPVTESDLLTNY